MYYFLREDFEQLNAKIVEICKKMEKIGKEIGESCQEGADTWHDNFAYEEGMRLQRMWSNRIRELINIRNNAQVVESAAETDSVRIGKIVTFENQDTKEIHVFRIGSFMNFEQKRGVKTISYSAPVARIILLAKEGEIKKGRIAKKDVEFKILKIE